LLFYGLFFQAAVAQNTSERYPGFGWTLINNSSSTNSPTYYYYPLQEGMEFSPKSLCIFGWFSEKRTQTPATYIGLPEYLFILLWK
jgi:hypothetical protein